MDQTQFLLPKARCPETGETVKIQDLTGARYQLTQRSMAEDSARQLADRMAARTGRRWVGYVEAYVPSKRLR